MARTSRRTTGEYVLQFDRELSQCVWLVSSMDVPVAVWLETQSVTSPRSLDVTAHATSTNTWTRADARFHLAVIC